MNRCALALLAAVMIALVGHDALAWTRIAGSSIQVSIGANDDLWVLGTDQRPGGYGIWYLRNGRWVRVDGGAVRIAVDPHGNPWVVNDNKSIFRRVGGVDGHWENVPGSALDIAVGADGSVWSIGAGQYSDGGFPIQYWTGSGWTTIDGAATRIAVDPSGAPWVVNTHGYIYKRVRGRWEVLPGRAVAIGIGANGTVWVVGTDPQPGGGGLYRWDGSDWRRDAQVQALDVAVDRSGRAYFITGDRDLWGP